MTITIYEPQGKAREYSPLALNTYKGCDHNCFYCYVPDMMTRFNPAYNHKEVLLRENVLKDLVKSAKKYRGTDKQVLFSFTTDPYNHLNDKYKLTREALKILLEENIPVAILTKGGMRTVQDIDIIKQFGNSIKVGTTLTFDNDEHSLEYETGAAPFSERLEMLKYFTENKIQTWVSIEPVLNHKQSLNCIKESLSYVNHYKIGKLNHLPDIEKKIDWALFLSDCVEIMRKENKEFYIKEDLRKWNKGTVLNTNEIDMDFLNVKPFQKLNLFTEQKGKAV